MGINLYTILMFMLVIAGVLFTIYQIKKLSMYKPIPEHILFPDQIPYEMNWLNVRSAINQEEWTKISNDVAEEAQHVCSICNQTGKEQGYTHDTECHEVWEINDLLKIQKLVGFQALCPRCHMVKHLGFTRRRGQSKESFEHLCKVNNSNVHTGLQLLSYYNNIVRTRKFVYRLDLSYLNKYPELLKYDFNGLDAIKCHKQAFENTDHNRREQDRQNFNS